MGFRGSGLVFRFGIGFSYPAAPNVAARNRQSPAETIADSWDPSPQRIQWMPTCIWGSVSRVANMKFGVSTSVGPAPVLFVCFWLGSDRIGWCGASGGPLSSDMCVNGASPAVTSILISGVWLDCWRFWGLKSPTRRRCNLSRFRCVEGVQWLPIAMCKPSVPSCVSKYNQFQNLLNLKQLSKHAKAFVERKTLH